MGLVSQHPHIVTVFNAAFTTTKQPCIVMELYSGGTLGERLKRDGRLPVATVLDVGVKIAGALQTAHDRGLLHRDIKPQNLFISEFGEPALGDFGISTLDDERSISGGGGLTVHYAPPEVLEGSAATAVSDVYSFAATLFTLLDGTRPFAPPAGSASRSASWPGGSCSRTRRTLRRDDVPRSLVAAGPHDVEAARGPPAVGGRARPGAAARAGRARAGVTPLPLATPPPPRPARGGDPAGRGVDAPAPPARRAAAGAGARRRPAVAAAGVEIRLARRRRRRRRARPHPHRHRRPGAGRRPSRRRRESHTTRRVVLGTVAAVVCLLAVALSLLLFGRRRGRRRRRAATVPASQPRLDSRPAAAERHRRRPPQPRTRSSWRGRPSVTARRGCATRSCPETTRDAAQRTDRADGDVRDRPRRHARASPSSPSTPSAASRDRSAPRLPVTSGSGRVVAVQSRVLVGSHRLMRHRMNAARQRTLGVPAGEAARSSSDRIGVGLARGQPWRTSSSSGPRSPGCGRARRCAPTATPGRSR